MADDQGDSGSDTSSNDSDYESTNGSDTEELASRLKQVLQHPVTYSGVRKFSVNIQSVADENSEDKEKGGNHPVMIIYSQLKEEEKENQEKQKEDAAKESPASNDTKDQPGPSKDPDSCPPKSPK